MILSETLDYLARPIINIFSDDFDESQYWMPDWLVEQLQTATIPNLSDLFLSDQSDVYDTDTDIYCEFSDIEDKTGFGLIVNWSHYPYVFPTHDNDIDPDKNYAFILCDNGGSTFAHISSIRVIEKVHGYDNLPNPQPLPLLLSTTSIEGEIAGQCDNQDVSELQPAARITVEAS